ncbi:MAG: Uncharacterized protein E1N59_305 [Puniceicoccaceae bacterium 5H]|nr:MAG: Uncharacterized protein E1N59_305 [Puniceicoccaceae bacterium 5H]
MRLKLLLIPLLVGISVYAQKPHEHASQEQVSIPVIASADAVIDQISEDNIEAAKEADKVFAAARYLAAEGDLEEARRYFIVGLQLSPWTLSAQLDYARLLLRLGENERARETAQIVFRSTEDQALLEASASMLGRTLEVAPPPLPADEVEEPSICLVAVGPVDAYILNWAASYLEQTLGVPVYLFSHQLEVSEADRSYLQHWVNRIKGDISWEHPTVQDLAEQMGIDKESATPEQTLELMAQLMELQGEEAPGRETYLGWIEDARERDAQWDVDRLLNQLDRIVPSRENIKFVGIASVDLYSEDHNFQFGSAFTGGKAAVISYRRFTADFNDTEDDRHRLLNRLKKQLLSSVGHLYEVPRPTDPRSARAYPDGLEQHDLKGTWLTWAEIEAFEKALDHPLPPATRAAARRALNE